MRSLGIIRKLKRWFRLGWGKSSNLKAASRVLVSVYVQPKSMPPRHIFSFASRRILLTTSIWSVVILLSVVFFIYTLLLVSVERPFQRPSVKKESLHGVLADYARPKLKFLGRGVGSRNSSQFSFSSLQRKQFWNPDQFDDPVSSLPSCQRGSLFIVLITSSPDHFEHRRQIRNTWCNPTLSTQEDSWWQCVFLIGQTNDTDITTKLKQESQSHPDILRGSYVDSYRNLTCKVMHGISWVSSKCEAPYLLKTDDDCFANTVLLQQFLLHHNTQTTKLYAGGMVVKEEKRKVIRKVSEKWSVSPEDYQPEYYPMYASGSGYVLSFDVVTRAVEESRYIKPIPNEDAYIGIVMDHLGVAPKLSGRFTLSSTGLRVCNFLYIFVAHGIAPDMHKDMCHKMMAAQRECWSKEDVTDWF